MDMCSRVLLLESRKLDTDHSMIPLHEQEARTFAQGDARVVEAVILNEVRDLCRVNGDSSLRMTALRAYLLFA